MPIYEYAVREEGRGCPHCAGGFEVMQRMSDAPLTTCPQCGAPIAKQVSAPAVGHSKSGFDDRAKAAGFHKLQKVSKGEYERAY